jgi:hypothetical protein
MNAVPNRQDQWIDLVFDHPVLIAAWYWDLDAPDWDGDDDEVAELIAETFERSGDLLARFTDQQLNQGFWYLNDPACSNLSFALCDPSVPESFRLRALRSFVPLFEDTMANRCAQDLDHCAEPGPIRLNSACYMWWDLLPLSPGGSGGKASEAEALAVMQRILAIPHLACQESALHGLGHWQHGYPDRVAEIIDAFLQANPQLDPRLVSYAHKARGGYVN